MAWHANISLEVAVEFRRLSFRTWDVVEDKLWSIRHAEHAAWADHGQWWRRTAIGRRYAREYSRKRATRLKAVVVAVRGCVACGKPFEVTAYGVARKRARVCSVECRGRARKNIQLITIGHESLPLATWAERRGLKLSTVWARVKRGWPITTALVNGSKEGT
jgi:hypothetical protein